MKATKSFAIIIAMLLGCITANAQTEIGGIWYNLNGNNRTASVAGDGTYDGTDNNNSYSGDIVIPSTVTYNEVVYNVTSIEIYAFHNCSNLTSVTIPEGVTSIRELTFSDCSKLTSVTIPDGVTSIGYNAFSNCSSLTSINIPETVTSIGHTAFSNCSSLTSINIPEGVTSIGNETFYNCSMLTSINIPEGVTSIGNQTFFGCSKLTSVTIPDGVTSIGANAFEFCDNLKAVYITDIESWFNISFANNHANPTTNGANLYVDSALLTAVTVPNTVTTLKPYTFVGCPDILSIDIHSGVDNINNSSTGSIPQICLKATTPPTLVKQEAYEDNIDRIIIVPASAYDTYCTADVWSEYGDQITHDEVGKRTLALTAEADKSALQVTAGDENLKLIYDLTISGTINSYDFMVLRNKMPMLRHLDMSEASIVYNAYKHYENYNTEDNKFPDYGLYNCKFFTLSLPQNITSIGNSALAWNAKLKEVVIPEGVTSIENGAFSHCESISSLIIPNSVTSIGGNAFSNCNKLKSVNIPYGTSWINDNTFHGCHDLQSITLPPTVTHIGRSAFNNCEDLKEIRIPSSVREIKGLAFNGCLQLKDIYVYTVEPLNIEQNTFDKVDNNFTGTLHAPKVSYWNYYYNTQWSQFTSFAEFDEPYENFYLESDKVLDGTTGSIEGEGENNPDAELGDNSGLVVEDDVEQELGNTDIEHDGEDGGSIIVDGTGHVNADTLNFNINVQGGRWYFFCFPFDIKAEDIRCEGGAEWVFRYYDGEERAKKGNGGWKNVTADGDGNFLKAATGYIFQCSKNDVLILTAKNGKIKKEDKYNELVEHITENTHDANWNFVGNPYLSYYEISSEDYSAPITVWDGSNYIAIRPGDDDYQLAPFEAFFVQKPEGKDKVNYNSERQKTHNQAEESAAAARSMRARQAIDPNRLLVNISLSNGENTDRTRVVFNNSADMKYETACDAAKFSTQGIPQIYTMDASAVKYAINERPLAHGNVSVGYSVPTKGSYTVDAQRMDTGMLLKDNLTGNVHDLTKGAYEFTSEAGTFDTRFTLIIKGDATAIDKVQDEDNDNATIYNVKGQQVDKMEQGDVYIKDNRKVIK